MYFKCNRNELIKASLTNDPWVIRAQDSHENHDVEVEELCRVRAAVSGLFYHIIY